VCVLVRFAVKFYLLPKSKRFYTPVTWAAPEGRGHPRKKLMVIKCPLANHANMWPIICDAIFARQQRYL